VGEVDGVDGVDEGGVSYRTEEWRYTEWGDAKGPRAVELYDLGKDPGEFENVAYADEYKKIRRKLAKELAARKVAAGFEG
jgi:hypothetical protein